MYVYCTYPMRIVYILPVPIAFDGEIQSLKITISEPKPFPFSLFELYSTIWQTNTSVHCMNYPILAWRFPTTNTWYGIL